MILIFLGSWRSTLIIAVSIPLSILTSIIVLSLLHETINIMTLGGLALAVGILVDDATVTIENIERYLEEGHEMREAHPRRRRTDRRSGARLHAVHLHRLPADVLPQRCRALPFRTARRSGRLRHARVLPSLAHTGSHAGDVPAQREGQGRAPFATIRSYASSAPSSVASNDYAPTTRSLLEALVAPQQDLRSGISLLLALPSFLLVPWLGQDFFPTTDNGQFILHLRAKTGTRIEETARLCDEVESSIRQTVPTQEMDTIAR